MLLLLFPIDGLGFPCQILYEVYSRVDFCKVDFVAD